MLVRNLVAWAGEGFSYVDGDVIDMPDAMAQARIEAGVAEAARGAGRGRSVLPWLGDVAAPVEPAIDPAAAPADPAAAPVDPDPAPVDPAAAPVDPDPAPLGE